MWIIAFVAIAGLLIIMSMRGRKAAQREFIMKAQTQ
jgi:hypothetical protein